jgi:hypothetical protein
MVPLETGTLTDVRQLIRFDTSDPPWPEADGSSPKSPIRLNSWRCGTNCAPALRLPVLVNSPNML